MTLPDSDTFKGSGGGGGSSTPQRTPDNLLSQDYAEVILAICSGPIKGLVSDPAPHGPLENFFFGDTSLQNVADQKSNFADFKVTQYVGNPEDPDIKRVLGGDASNLSVNTKMLQSIPVVRTTPPNLRKTVNFAGLDRLEVRILFNTIVKQDDKGSFDATAEFKLEYKSSISSIWLNYNSQAVTTITGKTTSGYVKDFLIDVDPLTNADYDVRLTKLSPDNGTQTLIDFTWESLQMVTLGKPRYDGLALLHIYGKVTAQFSSLPDMSGIYDLQLIQVPTNYNPETRTYNEAVPWNGTFKTAWSNNPAWVLWWLITNTEKGLARYYNHVAANRGEFYAAGKWCDEQVPSGEVGVTQPRFTFNEVFTEQKLGLELLTYVAGAFNSTIYDSGNGVIRLKTDQLTTPRMIFTPENVTDGIFNYSFTDITARPNDITVQFINPAFNWNVDERSATINASEWIQQNGRIPLDFTAVGCTNAHEAIRRANDRLLTANTEITQVTLETTRFGMLCELYDVIYIADPDSGWSTGGRIKSYANGVIQLRDPIFFESQLVVNLKIQTFSGLVDIGVTPPQLGLVYSLNVVTGIYPTNVVPDRTVFTVENTSNLGLAKPFRVAGIIEVDGNPDKYSINAVEMNPNKYADSANGTISDPVKYDFETPGEPTLPLTLTIENLPPSVSSDGTLIYRVEGKWLRPFQAYTEYYEFEYQEKGTTAWELYKVYGESQEIKPLKDGGLYNFRLWAISPTKMRSSKALYVYNWLVTKKNSILEDVTGLALTQTNKGWEASWNAPVNTPDLAGTRIKFSNPPKLWQELPNLYLSPSRTQDLPWFIAGSVRVHAKYINTSGNESSNSAIFNLTILAPSAPVVTVASSFGSNILTFSDPTTSQPLLQILIRKGNATSTWENAGISNFTLGTNQRTFSISPDATQATRVFLRAVDVAGNQGSITQVEIPPGANSVSELLEAVRGDIDETWLTPGLLNHINYGDPSVVGGLAYQVADLKFNKEQFAPFYVTNWKELTPNYTQWTGQNLSINLTNDGAILVSTSNDPIITSPNLALNGRLYDKLRVKIKRLTGTGWDGTVFYATATHSISGAYNSVVTLDPTILNQWVVVDWDMTTTLNNDWRAGNLISNVRFDFGVTPSDSFLVEYIAFGRYGLGVTRAEVQTEIQTRASETGFLGASWTTRVALTVGGIPAIAGISIAGFSTPTQGPIFDMTIRSNKIAFLPPTGVAADVPTYPFIYYTTATVLPSGITVQPGLYTKNAFIEYVTSDQIDTRGLTVKDYAGNVLFGVNQNLDWTRLQGQAYGQNLLYNSAFDNLFDGWNFFAGGSVVSASGFNLDNFWAPLPINSPGNRTFYAQQIGELPNSSNLYSEWGGTATALLPNTRYVISAYTGAHRCTVAIFLRVHRLNGSLAADGQGFAINASEAFGGQSLSNFKRVVGSFTTPADASYGTFYYRKYSTTPGQPNSYMLITKMQIEQVGFNGVTPSPWADTSPDRSAVRPSNPLTAANITTYIQGAAIGYAQIQYILANQIQTTSLSAISANIGFLSSRVNNTGAGFEQNSSGYKLFNSSNQLMYNLQVALGAVTLRVGFESGSNMYWNGTQLLITNATFDNFTATIPDGDLNIGNVQNGFASYGLRAVSVTGGKLPLSYMWFTQLTSGNYSSQFFCTSGGANVVVAGTGLGVTGVYNAGYLNCIVVDANGRLTATKIRVTATHGPDPAPGAGGGGGGEGGV